MVLNFADDHRTDFGQRVDRPEGVDAEAHEIDASAGRHGAVSMTVVRPKLGARAIDSVMGEDHLATADLIELERQFVIIHPPIAAG